MADCHIHDDKATNPTLTVAQVAAQLNTSSRTVQRWIKAGKLRAIRLPGGRSYRIYQRDIDAALEIVGISA
ncbi:excisionase [Mycobacterium heckeshornense]|uniref:excisionase family DNA-binding protein n=1 Tax=Mycobacterium TaxID=1763 RepID=UPI0008FD06E6|nr:MULTISPECIES: excisionase family DNA-binding protein [Mycobacterium]ORX21630.1 excisionase [Mycobacterium xenopi]PIJ36767.1 excisionase [Mycobacterium heckeshornense]PIJ36818.1 excisionase [Mycobacterium heckeshornense]